MYATLRGLAALLILATSCAKAPASTGDATSPTPRVARNPDVISREELHDPAIAATDAQTAIRQLRPAFFRTRGPQSFSNATAGSVQISQDYGPLQPLQQLASLSTRTLIEVRYLSAVDAQARFGINANGGPVIVLLTSRQ